jgi:DNA-binding NarL/FixJ family response regulator
MVGTLSRGITVYLIDDEAMVRAGLRALVERASGFQVVGEAGDAREGVRAIGALRPDVAIVDIAMPGLSGLDALPAIKQASPSTRVLIASQHEGRRMVHQAIAAGADGYLSKSSEPEELLVAIQSICRGDTFVSSRIAGALANWLRSHDHEEVSALDALTPREREVFQLIAIGRANKEIAEALAVSLGTVKKHRENLQRKLDCRSAAELARLAIREGLLNP